VRLLASERRQHESDIELASEVSLSFSSLRCCININIIINININININIIILTTHTPCLLNLSVD